MIVLLGWAIVWLDGKAKLAHMHDAEPRQAKKGHSILSRHARAATIFWYFLRFLGLLGCLPLTAHSQPAQVTLIKPPAVSNASFSIGVAAPLGRTYEIEVTTNLNSWAPVITNIVGDFASFTDTNATRVSQRSYRAVLHWTITVPTNALGTRTWEMSGRSDGRGPPIAPLSSDGRIVMYPSSWIETQGADGRDVAFPREWSTAQGADGRMIAFPTGWATVQGPDGRLVAFPASGFATVTGADGRVSVHPAPGANAGTNSYVSADWKFSIGRDGRKISFPSSNFSTNAGSDGRVVAYPSSSWPVTHGQDARLVAYPGTGFGTTNGADGRIIAYPSQSGWKSLCGPDGRQVAIPAFYLDFDFGSPFTDVTTIDLDLQDQQLVAFLGHLRTLLSDTDFYNYVLYTYFGTGEQQFPD